MIVGQPVDEELAFSAKDAAALAGISLRKLRQWAEKDLVTPSIGRGSTRLYAFPEMVELLVAQKLRERKMSLQQIRKIVGHLRKRGYQKPLRELRWATIGKEIYVQHTDGTWEGGLHPDQEVIVDVVIIHLDPLRATIRESVRRDDDARGKVVAHSGVQAGEPIFAGTRIRVATIQRYVDAGYTTEAILEEYPNLTEADVEAARQRTRAAS